jgi:hypothetical protein
VRVFCPLLIDAAPPGDNSLFRMLSRSYALAHVAVLCALLAGCHLAFPYASRSPAADADAATLDGAADEAGETTDGPRPTCTAKYGTVPGFILCEETATDCSFNVATDYVTSCTTVCAGAGGACLDAIDNPNDPGTECEEATDAQPVTCDSSTFETMLCVCDR